LVSVSAFCWWLSMLSSSSPFYPWPGRFLATLSYRFKNSGRMMKSRNSPYFLWPAGHILFFI